MKHQIKLEKEEPFKEPYRRIPPGLIQEVREHLEEMLKAEAIRESESPYSSNLVIVRKKDGFIRFCVDFRKLNRRTIKDAYAIPSDKPKTAIQVGTLGFFEFNRMHFGLCNAPATFQRLMERCMGEMILRDCLSYLDDILIFLSSFEEHLEKLQEVFERLQEHNLVSFSNTRCPSWDMLCLSPESERIQIK